MGSSWGGPPNIANMPPPISRTCEGRGEEACGQARSVAEADLECMRFGSRCRSMPCHEDWLPNT
eukprot:scaffold161402_cov30-Tisochrysis_lutea.AAC.5